MIIHNFGTTALGLLKLRIWNKIDIVNSLWKNERVAISSFRENKCWFCEGLTAIGCRCAMFSPTDFWKNLRQLPWSRTLWRVIESMYNKVLSLMTLLTYYWGVIYWGATIHGGNYPGDNFPGGNLPITWGQLSWGKHPWGNCPVTSAPLLESNRRVSNVSRHFSCTSC